MQNCPFPVIDLEATGRNILRLRLAAGLTVRDLQAWFGFDAPQAIYRWQTGKSLPTVDHLYALSKLLNVPMEDIIVPMSGPQTEVGGSFSLYHVLCGLSLNHRFNLHPAFACAGGHDVLSSYKTFQSEVSVRDCPGNQSLCPLPWRRPLRHRQHRPLLCGAQGLPSP